MNNNNLDDLLFAPCIFCKKSQQQAMCDVLTDTKCQLNICTRCFKFNKENICQKCPLKVKDHHKKTRNTKKELLLEQGTKMYERQYKIRSNWEELDPELVNIMAYYYRKRKGNDYDKKQNQLKIILQEAKKQQTLVLCKLRKNNTIQFLDNEANGDGKQACGYQNNQQKGLKFLFQSFS